jgi:S1-C subfamily serine protease
VPGLSGHRAAAALALLAAATLILALLWPHGSPGWQAAVPAAVEIRASGCGPAVRRGSGVVVAEERVVTVAHLVAGAEAVVVGDVRGRRRPAGLLALDPERDLALLQVEGLDGSSLAGGEPEAGQQGRVLRFTTSGFDPIRFRLVRRVRARIFDLYGSRTAERDALEIEAAIDPGDSGAALVDDVGALMGILFASSRRVEGTAYAVAVSELRPLLSAPESRGGHLGRCP